MARYANFAVQALLASHLIGAAWAVDNVDVTFTGTILDGTCGLTLSEHQLFFGTHRATDFAANSAVVALLPLTATVTCDETTLPRIGITGTAPNAGIPTVFRDGGGSNGAGFMVRQNTGGLTPATFYNESLAMANGGSMLVSSPSAIAANTPYQEHFLLGLVRAQSVPVVPEIIHANLTFTAYFD